MDKALSSFQMEIIIKEILKMDYLRGKVNLFGKMVQHSQEYLKMGRKMEKGF